MSVQPSDLLHFAESLAQNYSDDEVAMRTATSRAYYAAYHDCVSWHQQLPSPGISTKRGGVHQKLIHQLKNPTISQTQNSPDWRLSKQRGKFLENLKALRVKADYALLTGKIDAKGDAVDAIEQAKLILSLN